MSLSGIIALFSCLLECYGDKHVHFGTDGTQIRIVVYERQNANGDKNLNLNEIVTKRLSVGSNKWNFYFNDFFKPSYYKTKQDLNEKSNQINIMMFIIDLFLLVFLSKLRWFFLTDPS